MVKRKCDIMVVVREKCVQNFGEAEKDRLGERHRVIEGIEIWVLNNVYNELGKRAHYDAK